MTKNKINDNELLSPYFHLFLYRLIYKSMKWKWLVARIQGSMLTDDFERKVALKHSRATLEHNLLMPKSSYQSINLKVNSSPQKNNAQLLQVID